MGNFWGSLTPHQLAAEQKAKLDTIINRLDAQKLGLSNQETRLLEKSRSLGMRASSTSIRATASSIVQLRAQQHRLDGATNDLRNLNAELTNAIVTGMIGECLVKSERGVAILNRRLQMPVVYRSVQRLGVNLDHLRVKSTMMSDGVHDAIGDDLKDKASQDEIRQQLEDEIAMEIRDGLCDMRVDPTRLSVSAVVANKPDQKDKPSDK